MPSASPSHVVVAVSPEASNQGEARPDGSACSVPEQSGHCGRFSKCVLYRHIGRVLELRLRAWEPAASAELPPERHSGLLVNSFAPPGIRERFTHTGHCRRRTIASGAEGSSGGGPGGRPNIMRTFDIAQARRVTLDALKLVYVSYRIGNKVFSTKHKVANCERAKPC